MEVDGEVNNETEALHSENSNLKSENSNLKNLVSVLTRRNRFLEKQSRFFRKLVKLQRTGRKIKRKTNFHGKLRQKLKYLRNCKKSIKDDFVFKKPEIPRQFHSQRQLSTPEKSKPTKSKTGKLTVWHNGEEIDETDAQEIIERTSSLTIPLERINPESETIKIKEDPDYDEDDYDIPGYVEDNDDSDEDYDPLETKTKIKSEVYDAEIPSMVSNGFYHKDPLQIKTDNDKPDRTPLNALPDILLKGQNRNTIRKKNQIGKKFEEFICQNHAITKEALKQFLVGDLERFERILINFWRLYRVQLTPGSMAPAEEPKKLPNIKSFRVQKSSLTKYLKETMDFDVKSFSRWRIWVIKHEEMLLKAEQGEEVTEVTFEDITEEEIADLEQRESKWKDPQRKGMKDHRKQVSKHFTEWVEQNYQVSQRQSAVNFELFNLDKGLSLAGNSKICLILSK